MASHDDIGGATNENGVETTSLAAKVKETGNDPDEFNVPVCFCIALFVQLPQVCARTMLQKVT